MSHEEGQGLGQAAVKKGLPGEQTSLKLRLLSGKNQNENPKESNFY